MNAVINSLATFALRRFSIQNFFVIYNTHFSWSLYLDEIVRIVLYRWDCCCRYGFDILDYGITAYLMGVHGSPWESVVVGGSPSVCVDHMGVGYW